MRRSLASTGVLLIACAAALLPAGLAANSGPSASAPPPANATQPGDAFALWLTDLRAVARARGISATTLDRSLAGLRPIERVIELDRRQPEFIDTFLNYLGSRVSESRIAKGKEMLSRHAPLLSEVAQRYGVPPRYLVALWGMETNYGSHLGSYPVIASLATLAFDSRRPTFFREQLLAALRIVDQGHAEPAGLYGSWAGAMGQMQFIPGTFLAYAVDADGDGRKDLWNNLADALHSGANYLKRAGWRDDEDWGREVRLPDGFDLRLAEHGNEWPIRDWASLGIRLPSGAPLSDDLRPASLLLPQGRGGPAFLVQRNFDVILDWNRSVSYALAVGLLADRLVDLPPLSGGLDADNRRLSRDDAVAIQQLLSQLGFDPGDADGIPGRRTRAAIRAYQASTGLPADGYPSVSLLEHLRARTDPASTTVTPDARAADPAGSLRVPALSVTGRPS